MSLGVVPVPSCADIRGTFPSAWTSTQLGRMSQVDLEQCVEVFGQDASLSSEQRWSLWAKLRQVSKTWPTKDQDEVQNVSAHEFLYLFDVIFTFEASIQIVLLQTSVNPTFSRLWIMQRLFGSVSNDVYHPSHFFKVLLEM